MRIEPSTSKTRRFQEQLIPPYLNTELDFYYDLSLFSPSSDVEFGLKSSDGTIRSKYNLKSGLIYDYSGRFVGTYREGQTRLEFGLKSGLILSTGNSFFSTYEKINGRPIAFEDIYGGYEAKPFDRFYISNNGAAAFDFDLSIRGFSPPTLYSNLVNIGGNTYSGHLTQSGTDVYPSQKVPYGLFGLTVPSSVGTVTSFDSTGLGYVSYLIDGGDLTEGQAVSIEFDTFFGKTTQTVLVGAGSDGETITIGTETGTSIHIHGPTNLLPANGEIIFGVDYYSNAANNVYVELSSSSSFASALLSGSGMGFLSYSGYVSKTGSIYSSAFITGVADLESTDNDTYNTEYLLADRYINISKRTTSRATGVWYTGENTFVYTGVPIIGVYDGPYVPFIGMSFSGSGDVSVTYEFAETDEGVHTFNENWVGTLNTGYSPYFYIAASSVDLSSPANRMQYNSSNATLFPTGQGEGFISATETGRGIVTRIEAMGMFFGEGTGQVYTSRIELDGSGPGEVLFRGDAYNWVDYGTTEIFPPIPNMPAILEPEIAGCVFRLELHNGDNVPTSIYKDISLSEPATEEGDLVAAWVDSVGDIAMYQPEESERPYLTFIGGVPNLRFTDGQCLRGTKDWSFLTSALTVVNYTPLSDTSFTVFEAGSAERGTWYRYTDGLAYMGIFRVARMDAIYSEPTVGDQVLSVWSSNIAYQAWKNGTMVMDEGGDFEAIEPNITIGHTTNVTDLGQHFNGLVRSIYVHPELAVRESLEEMSDLMTTYSALSGPECLGAYDLLDMVEGKGRLYDGSQYFDGTGLPVPQYQTWGYPTGPSQIHIPAMTLEVYETLPLVDVTGYRGSVGGSLTPEVTGFAGRALGYVTFSVGTVPGPVFPAPDDITLYPYNGDNQTLFTEGGVYYGRGVIISSGGADSPGGQQGIYIDSPDMEVTYDIQVDDFRGQFVTTCSRAFLPVPVIYPARRVDFGFGEELSHDTIYLTFDDPEINKVEDATIEGHGFLPSTNLTLKYNMFYSTEEGTFDVDGYKEKAWIDGASYIRMVDGAPAPFPYPVGAQRAYIKVKSDSPDTDSFDELSLKVYTSQKTGEVVISTNANV